MYIYQYVTLLFQKVLFEEKKTPLYLNFYVAVMPSLKNCVMLFQVKDPQFTGLILLRRTFSGSFYHSSSDLKQKNTPLSSEFMTQVSKAYTECGTHLQMKIPLSSDTLETLACLDPDFARMWIPFRCLL